MRGWAFLLLAWMSPQTGATSLPYPSIQKKIRVKNHFHRSGELVDGEKHLRKVIIKWDHYPGALRYEVNHVFPNEEDQKIHTTVIERDNTCGGYPCHVKPACPLGMNAFSVRASLASDNEGGEDTWTPWSPLVTFQIDRALGHATAIEQGDLGNDEL